MTKDKGLWKTTIFGKFFCLLKTVKFWYKYKSIKNMNILHCIEIRSIYWFLTDKIDFLRGKVGIFPSLISLVKINGKIFHCQCFTFPSIGIIWKSFCWNSLTWKNIYINCLYLFENKKSEKSRIHWKV